MPSFSSVKRHKVDSRQQSMFGLFDDRPIAPPPYKPSRFDHPPDMLGWSEEARFRYQIERDKHSLQNETIDDDVRQMYLDRIKLFEEALCPPPSS